jgi:hypothetical protein
MEKKTTRRQKKASASFERYTLPAITSSEVTKAMPFRWPKSQAIDAARSPKKIRPAPSLAGVNPKIDKMLQQSKSALSTSFARYAFDSAIYGKTNLEGFSNEYSPAAQEGVGSSIAQKNRPVVEKISQHKVPSDLIQRHADPSVETPFVISSLLSGPMRDVPIPLTAEEAATQRQLKKILAPQLHALKPQTRARRKRRGPTKHIPMHVKDAMLREQDDGSVSDQASYVSGGLDFDWDG